MLPIEQEPIRLSERLSLKTVVPQRFQFLWDQVRMGASLYDLCLRVRAQRRGNRVFLEVATFLCFLVDHDLVDEPRLVRLADSIRGEYQWPEGLFATVSHSEVFQTWPREKKESRLVAQAFEGFFSLAVLLGLPASLFLTLSTSRGNSEPWAFVAGLYAVGIIGRTGVSMLRAIACQLAGDAGGLSFKVDLLGPYLGFEPQTVTGSLRRATDFIACLGFALVVVALSLMGMSQLVLIGALAGAALFTHPASASALTGSLRVWNRTPLSWREDDELVEVESFHRIGGTVSVVLAIATLFLCVKLSSIGAGGWGFMAGAGLWLILYIEPFFSHSVPGSARRNRRRRLWATKPRVLSIAGDDRDAWNELPVLRQLTAPLRKQLVSKARIVEFQIGQAVCRQGGTDRSLYIVLDGELAVAKSFAEKQRRKVVAFLTAGSVFGETAFFFGHTRTADVVATAPCRLLEIPFQESMQNLDLTSSEEFQFRIWLLQALSASEMFRELPSEAMDMLIFAGKRRVFKAGAAIFTEGAPGDSCYFIAQGRASVVKGGKKINEVGAGSAFGEIALLRPGSTRTASVVADSDLLCMELETDAFWSLLSARLALGVEVERLAAHRLQLDQERQN